MATVDPQQPQPPMPDRETAHDFCRDFAVLNNYEYRPAFCILAVKSLQVAQEDLITQGIGGTCPCCEVTLSGSHPSTLIKLACCDQIYHKACAVKFVLKRGPQKCQNCRSILTPADSHFYEEEAIMMNLRMEMTRREAELMIDGFYLKPAVLKYAEDLWNPEKLGRHASTAEAYQSCGPAERMLTKREGKRKRVAESEAARPVLGVYKWKDGSRWVNLPAGAAVGPASYYHDDPEKMLRKAKRPRLPASVPRLPASADARRESSGNTRKQTLLSTSSTPTVETGERMLQTQVASGSTEKKDNGNTDDNSGSKSPHDVVGRDRLLGKTNSSSTHLQDHEAQSNEEKVYVYFTYSNRLGFQDNLSMINIYMHGLKPA
ncbi:hypothetical protein EJ03DRAFT_339687 [Teratosphaeria nubilosa]|uniref:Uncharacterized protein n=1 Tax=Teratosphaeria nubilosa TaxID=161662 RepID=A0A6G1KVY1_9PEZI|nr:hypothetical protein EJ03DRAFT_339687 [Teratosphaeria nubilosa]